jgi:hypothetical protein
MSQVVDAIEPAAVLCCVLDAEVGGYIEWSSPRCSPLVFTWFGLTGHDRHNTHPDRRPFKAWASLAAQEIQARRQAAR